MTGGNKLASKNLLYIETGWIPLYKRREDHRLIQLFKIYHNKTPDYLYELLQTLLSQGNQYNTRNTNSIREIHTRTRLYFNSFFPKTIRRWNLIPSEIQDNPSLANFKKYLNPLRVKIPVYYNTGSRKSQILHSKLRLECSDLRFHLFRRNLCASPLCSCGSIENTEHYLLHCPKYNDIRRTTIHTLTYYTDINIALLLYGLPDLDVRTNRHVFEMVHAFISGSKRFT